MSTRKLTKKQLKEMIIREMDEQRRLKLKVSKEDFDHLIDAAQEFNESERARAYFDELKKRVYEENGLGDPFEDPDADKDLATFQEPSKFGEAAQPWLKVFNPPAKKSAKIAAEKKRERLRKLAAEKEEEEDVGESGWLVCSQCGEEMEGGTCSRKCRRAFDR